MLKTFGSIQPYFKFKPKEVSIDNLIFKFHYRWTFAILLLSTVLVTSRQYIGEHIKCIEQSGTLGNVIETFCFFTSTFTVVRHLNETALNAGHVPHPGIGPSLSEEPIIRHAYYQWVPFVLFGQALIFYLPHLLWKTWEGGKIKNLVNGLRMTKLSKYTEKEMKLNNFNIPSKDTAIKQITLIKSTFYNRLKLNIFWGPKLIICEILNFLNILLQIYLTNKFLGGLFYNLGHNVMDEKWNPKIDTLDIIFPKVTKCHFYKYGPSGTLQLHDTLCVMALNVINEKIYTFLWFWYGIIFFISGLALIWRIFTVLLHKSSSFNWLIFSYACPGRINRHNIEIVTRHCNFTDWMFLYFLGSNLNSYIFNHVIEQLCDEFHNMDEKKYKREKNNDNDKKPLANDDEIFGQNSNDPENGGHLMKEKHT